MKPVENVKLQNNDANSAENDMEKRPMPVRRFVGPGVPRTKRFARLNGVESFAAEIDTTFSEVAPNCPSSSNRDSDAGAFRRATQDGPYVSASRTAAVHAEKEALACPSSASKLQDIGDAGGGSYPPVGEN